MFPFRCGYTFWSAISFGTSSDVFQVNINRVEHDHQSTVYEFSLISSNLGKTQTCPTPMPFYMVAALLV